MALLNPPDLIPSVTRLVVETVGSRGGQMLLNDVIAYCAPGAIGGDASRTVEVSANAAITLGLLARDDDQVRLSSRVSSAAGVDGRLGASWGSLLRSMVRESDTLSKSVTANFDEAAEGERTSGVRDLAYGLTWVLAQDALGEPLAFGAKDGCRSVQDLQAVQFGQGRDTWPVTNDTRWHPLIRWGSAMGLVSAAPAGAGAGETIPDPTTAVRDVVLELAGSERRSLTFAEFRHIVGEELPYVDGGVLRAELAEALDGDPDPDVQAGGVDSSLGLALLALQVQRVILIEDRSDAQHRSVIDPKGRRIGVSHIIVLEDRQ
ncbi:MAG: protein DpdG [Dehalococcoidia bacterium]